MLSALAFAEANIPIIPVRLQRKGDGWGRSPRLQLASACNHRRCDD